MKKWPGWTRVDPRPWNKLNARWRHVDGWYLEHCGHPTALWPWDLYAPNRERVLHGVTVSGNPRHGRCWSRLEDVFTWVETQLGEKRWAA